MKKVIYMMVLMMAMSFCVSCGTDKIETGSTEASETTEKQAAEKAVRAAVPQAALILILLS